MRRLLLNHAVLRPGGVSEKQEHYVLLSQYDFNMLVWMSFLEHGKTLPTEATTMMCLPVGFFPSECFTDGPPIAIYGQSSEIELHEIPLLDDSDSSKFTVLSTLIGIWMDRRHLSLLTPPST